MAYIIENCTIYIIYLYIIYTFLSLKLLLILYFKIENKNKYDKILYIFKLRTINS